MLQKDLVAIKEAINEVRSLIGEADADLPFIKKNREAELEKTSAYDVLRGKSNVKLSKGEIDRGKKILHNLEKSYRNKSHRDKMHESFEQIKEAINEVRSLIGQEIQEKKMYQHNRDYPESGYNSTSLPKKVETKERVEKKVISRLKDDVKKHYKKQHPQGNKFFKSGSKKEQSKVSEQFENIVEAINEVRSLLSESSN